MKAQDRCQKILDEIEYEKNLNKEIMEMDREELEYLHNLRKEKIDNVYFYAKLAYSIDEYDIEKAMRLVSLIKRCNSNGVEFPESNNEAINIAAKNSWESFQIKNEIDAIVDDINKFIEEQRILEKLKKEANEHMKIYQKKL